MKTLVVRLDHLGDLLLTTPLVRALAQGGHEVDVLVRASLSEIFDGSLHVRNCFAVEAVAPAFPQDWRQLGRWMRGQSYDVIVLAYAKEKSLCFASAMSGTKRRIAMWGGIWGRLTLHECLRSDILTEPQPFSQILLKCADALEVPGQGLAPEIFLSNEERTATHNLMPPAICGRTLIGIHPGSAGNACNLPSAVYGELTSALLEKTDCAVVITGTQAELWLLAGWPGNVLSSERVWLTMGRLGIRELAATISKMSVYVCPSTGPLHLASATATVTVSPFCPMPPLCATIWGNTGAPSRVLEPAVCPRRADPDAPCCDFQGQIDATQILQSVMEVLSAGEIGDKR